MGQTKTRSQLLVLTGRRRVGKTLLSLEFAKGRKYLYLFVAKKSEALLCDEYLQEIKGLFKDVPVLDKIRTFKDIFFLLLQIASKITFTVIIDEFQEFYNINPSAYSEIQKLLDLNKGKSGLNVIFIGSVHSLMYKISQNTKEPFSVKTMARILHDQKIKNLKTFINEGKNVLIEEFGKEYGTYFSILELISVGKTSRSEIESILESNVGGYLDRLEKDYAILAKYKPINAKANSRTQKYKIVDNFLNFWFYFIYRNRSAIETGNFRYVRDVICRDY